MDGYSAPINGGNFVDLVQRGFYDGLPFIRSEDNFVVQTGDPVGAEEGFIDPKTKQYRSIPNELTLPGFNLMDGRYSVFGYLVQGKEVLEELTDQDKIISAKVVYGLNNLVQPS
ncbi:peptidyl-prolyl cis-trans isomerase [Microcystis aeruginosa NIES-3806]|nr:peptidyl-prolyl cis-trans isomerase [Microcystis aeruginosa NIES-3806]